MWIALLLLACGTPAPADEPTVDLTSPWTDWNLPLAGAEVVVSRSQALHLQTEAGLSETHEHWVMSLGALGWSADHTAKSPQLISSRLRKGSSDRLHLAVRRLGSHTAVTLALEPAPPPPPGVEL